MIPFLLSITYIILFICHIKSPIKTGIRLCLVSKLRRIVNSLVLYPSNLFWYLKNFSNSSWNKTGSPMEHVPDFYNNMDIDIYNCTVCTFLGTMTGTKLVQPFSTGLSFPNIATCKLSMTMFNFHPANSSVNWIWDEQEVIIQSMWKVFWW